MKEAIQKAIEGGWKPNLVQDHKDLCNCEGSPDHVAKDYCRYAGNDYSKALLDPLFWQALGKALGWRSEKELMPRTSRRYGDRRYALSTFVWKENWHRFIDHLAEGKDAESFFNEILK